MAKKKKKKRGFFKKFLAFVFIMAILCGVGYLGYNSYQKLTPLKDELLDIQSKFNAIPESWTDEVLVFDLNEYSLKGNWIFEEKYISSSRVITRPTYKENDAKTKITLDLDLKFDAIDKVILRLLKINIESISLTKTITIKALPMSDSDCVNEYLNNLVMPNVILSDVLFPTSSVKYENLECMFESSDESIITSSGKVMSFGLVDITCTVKLNDVEKKKTFSIQVLNEFLIQEIEYDFSDFDNKKYNKSTFDSIELSNALSDNEKVKFKVEKDSTEAYFKTNSIADVSSISFSYCYASGKENYTKSSYLELFSSIDGITYISLKKEELKDKEVKLFNYTSDVKDDLIYKVVLTTDYATEYLLIDDLKVTRRLNSNDIKKSLLFNLPNKVDGNFDLPFTTLYGGKVKYTSKSSNLTNTGQVIVQENSQEVKMGILITGFDEEISFDYEFQINGTTTVSPLEIRFIDVGKYGLGDCGESIYIRIDNIDLLIDAGENRDSTVKAIEEVINTYSADKVLDYVIATHPDSDHIGGMDTIINDYDVNYIIQFNNGYTSSIYKDYKEAVEKENCTTCTASDSLNNVNGCSKVIELAKDVTLEIIDTLHYDDVENNARSVVCVLNAYGVRTLFTGDADNLKANIEKDYMNKVGNVDILKVVHHGTRNGCTQEFLKTIDPEVAIICNGNYFGNKHGHPTIEAINNLYEYDSEMKVYAIVGGNVSNEVCRQQTSFECESDKMDVFYQRNGMITITIDNNGYTVMSEYYGENPLQIKDTDFYRVANENKK